MIERWQKDRGWGGREERRREKYFKFLRQKRRKYLWLNEVSDNYEQFVATSASLSNDAQVCVWQSGSTFLVVHLIHKTVLLTESWVHQEQCQGSSRAMCTHRWAMCTCGWALYTCGWAMCTYGWALCTHGWALCTYGWAMCMCGWAMCTHRWANIWRKRTELTVSKGSQFLPCWNDTLWGSPPYASRIW